MEEIQKMEAGGVYVLESRAAANSVYFETDRLAQIFFRYCNYYLKDYLNVHEYCLTQDGWVMLVKIKSAKTIRGHYAEIETRRKYKSGTMKADKPKEIWRIISERVRLFISTYVRMSNAELGRTGTLVRRKYSRYLCEDIETAQAYVKSIRNEEVVLRQPKSKYRGMAAYFCLSNGEKGMMLRSSAWVSKMACRHDLFDAIRGVFGCEMPVFKGLGEMVVLNSYLRDNPPNFHPK